MKKFLEEFKSFALRGNVMDMAVGVLIGGAFSGIVTSLTDKPEEPAQPTTKICPFCMSEIDIRATRCPHCTSVQPESEADQK